jgi:hypothetical protein
MEYQRGYYSQFKQYAFLWKPAFAQRHTDVYANENVPFVARPVEDPSGATITGDDRNIDTISTEDVVENFVNNDCDDDIDRYQYRNSQVSDFLEMGNMNILRSPIQSVEVSRPMALLDDRNNGNVSRENMAGNLRLNLGPLSAHQLFMELRKHVSRQRIETYLLSFALSFEHSVLIHTAYGFARPSRRRAAPDVSLLPTYILSLTKIYNRYVTDLDPFCAVALAATASKKQAAFLRDFMYKYLACRALIGVEIPVSLLRILFETLIVSFQAANSSINIVYWVFYVLIRISLAILCVAARCSW